jgi:hypothetical protein
METQLRLTLTLSDGASLGAYRSGATVAVLVAVQHMAGLRHLPRGGRVRLGRYVAHMGRVIAGAVMP